MPAIMWTLLRQGRSSVLAARHLSCHHPGRDREPEGAQAVESARPWLESQPAPGWPRPSCLSLTMWNWAKVKVPSQGCCVEQIQSLLRMLSNRAKTYSPEHRGQGGEGTGSGSLCEMPLGPPQVLWENWGPSVVPPVMVGPRHWLLCGCCGGSTVTLGVAFQVQESWLVHLHLPRQAGPSGSSPAPRSPCSPGAEAAWLAEVTRSTWSSLRPRVPCSPQTLMPAPQPDFQEFSRLSNGLALSF